MNPSQFDAITRSLGMARSRRNMLKTLGAAALGAIGLAGASRATVAARGGNSDCAHFCSSVFPPGPQRGKCVSDAAQGAGLCYGCGPTAQYTGLTLCGTVCVDTSSDTNNCGSCGTVCPAGEVCTNGSCASTCPSSTVTCTSDAQCGAGQVCEHGGCFVGCSNTRSCPPNCGGCVCSYSTDHRLLVCADFGTEIGACHHNADCPDGAICNAATGNGAGDNLCTRPCQH